MARLSHGHGYFVPKRGAAKLIEAMERHRQEIEVARGQLASERARVHELELMRTETRLEINMKQVKLPADTDRA
jgi:hypothetical protein